MENNFKTINYLNKDVKILQYLSESNKQFNKRLEFINKLESRNIPLKDAIKYSKIWSCINYKKCKYSPEIYNLISQFDK